MYAKWYGFEHGYQVVTYSIGLGSEPLLDDVKPFAPTEDDEILLFFYKLKFYKVVATDS